MRARARVDDRLGMRVPGHRSPNKRDNCPTVRSKALADLDRDGAGDVCDLDDDADGVEDRLDNCPRAANADQSDVDVDAIGDACQGPA